MVFGLTLRILAISLLIQKKKSILRLTLGWQRHNCMKGCLTEGTEADPVWKGVYRTLQKWEEGRTLEERTT